MSASFETTVKYEQLDSAITVVHQHHQLFWQSLLGIPLSTIVALTLIVGFKMPPFEFISGLAMAFVAISIVVAFITRKRVEYAQFNSTAGHPLLNVARAGPDRLRFDEYVAEIQSRIEAVHNDK